MIPISVCIIMKNEEKHIGNCLEALSRHGFGKKNHNRYGEIVVVDTGSEDRSVEIAREYTDSIHFFAWINDFSAAKNFAISKATGDYVLIIDADEYLESADMEQIQSLLVAHPHSIGMLLRSNYVEEDGIRSIHDDRVERLFSRRDYHYQYPIHEQVVPIQKEPPEKTASLACYPIPLRIMHYGYLLPKEDLDAKARRNNDILFEEIKKRPEDPYLYFQIGQSFMMMRDLASAYEWYKKGLAYDVNPQLEYVQMMVIGYGECMLNIGLEKEALSLASVYDDFSFTPEFVFLMGQIYLNNNMYMQAYGEFLKCLTMKKNRTQGVTSFFSYHNIGVINEILGNTEGAITFYKKAGDYPRSVERLKELGAL